MFEAIKRRFVLNFLLRVSRSKYCGLISNEEYSYRQLNIIANRFFGYGDESMKVIFEALVADGECELIHRHSFKQMEVWNLNHCAEDLLYLMGNKAVDSILETSKWRDLDAKTNRFANVLARMGKPCLPSVINYLWEHLNDVGRYNSADTQACYLSSFDTILELVQQLGIPVLSALIQHSIHPVRIGEWVNDDNQTAGLNFASSTLSEIGKTRPMLVANSLIENLTFLTREIGNHKTISFLTAVGKCSIPALVQMFYDHNINQNDSVSFVIRGKVVRALVTLEAMGTDVAMVYFEAAKSEDADYHYRQLPVEQQQKAFEKIRRKYEALFPQT